MSTIVQTVKYIVFKKIIEKSTKKKYVNAENIEDDIITSYTFHRITSMWLKHFSSVAATLRSRHFKFNVILYAP